MIQHTPDRFASMQQSFSDQASSASSRMRECIEDNPTSAVLVALAGGFAAGLVLASLLGGSDNYFSRADEESFVERIGHKVADSVANVLPSDWRKSLPFG